MLSERFSDVVAKSECRNPPPPLLSHSASPIFPRASQSASGASKRGRRQPLVLERRRQPPPPAPSQGFPQAKLKGSIVQPCVREFALFSVLKRVRVRRRRKRTRGDNKIKKIKKKCLQGASCRYFQYSHLEASWRSSLTLSRKCFICIMEWQILLLLHVVQSQSRERRLFFYCNRQFP